MQQIAPLLIRMAVAKKRPLLHRFRVYRLVKRTAILMYSAGMVPIPLHTCLVGVVRGESSGASRGLEVEKFQLREALEVGIEGNEAAARALGKGGEVGVGPAVGRKVTGFGVSSELDFNIERFAEKDDFRQGDENAVDFPRFRRRERAVLHDDGIGRQTEEAEHGDAAESEMRRPFLLPIMTGTGVMLVILAGEREPGIDVGQVNLRHGHLGRRGSKRFGRC